MHHEAPIHTNEVSHFSLPALVASSAYCGSGSVIYSVAATCGTLYGSGMLYAFYCLSTPILLMAVADFLELWIDTLPSQVRLAIYRN